MWFQHWLFSKSEKVLERLNEFWFPSCCVWTLDKRTHFAQTLSRFFQKCLCSLVLTSLSSREQELFLIAEWKKREKSWSHSWVPSKLSCFFSPFCVPGYHEGIPRGLFKYQTKLKAQGCYFWQEGIFFSFLSFFSGAKPVGKNKRQTRIHGRETKSYLTS